MPGDCDPIADPSPHRASSELADLARELGLERQITALASLARMSVRLLPGEAGDGAQIAASRFGGSPDLLPDFEWPTWTTGPMGFIAQIDLRRIPRSRGRPWVPPGGLMSFFFDGDAWAMGISPEDAGSGRVVLVSEEHLDRLERREPPSTIEREAVLPERHLRALLEDTLPTIHSPDVESLMLEATALDAYLELRERLAGGDVRAPASEAPIHRLGGHPDEVQANISDGLTAAAALARSCETSPPEACVAENWELLLQVGSDPVLGTQWGDEGRLYFFVPRRSMASGDYGNIWCVQQSA